MSSEDPDNSDPSSEVELIQDGDSLLVFGPSLSVVEAFLRSQSLLERAERFTNATLVHVARFAPALRASSSLIGKTADSIRESGLWVKLTTESAEAIKKYGLVDTGARGVKYAMAGSRGDLKEWLKIDFSASAMLTNPALLSGLAGVLSMVANEAEAAALRKMFRQIDTKLDKLDRKLDDPILGELRALEGALRSATRAAYSEHGVDTKLWDRINGAYLDLNKVRGIALARLKGVVTDMDGHQRIGELQQALPGLEQQALMWIDVIARCFAALDDYASVELSHRATADLEDTSGLERARVRLQEERSEALEEFSHEVTDLMRRMSETARRANHHSPVYRKAASEVVASLEGFRFPVRLLCDALGLDLDLDLDHVFTEEGSTPSTLIQALADREQRKVVFSDLGAVVKEKAPAVLTIAGFGILLGVAKGLLPSDTAEAEGGTDPEA